MLSTVGPQSDSARQSRSKHCLAGHTARAVSPETDLQSSVPDIVNLLLFNKVKAVSLHRTSQQSQVYIMVYTVKTCLIEKDCRQWG